MAVLVSDSFNRGDSSTLGTTDSYAGGTAKTWVAQTVPSPAISTNQANGKNAGDNCIAVVDSGVANCSISADVTVNSANEAWIDFRNADLSNKFTAAISKNGTLRILKFQSGLTVLASKTVTYGAGKTVKVVLNGNAIDLYYDGVLHLSTTNAFNNTVTKHGIGFYASTTDYIDNFKIEDLATGGTGTPGSISYATKQIIYQTSTIALATKQVINRTSATAYATKQTIYQVGSISYATQQTITDGGIPGAIGYRTKQIIYRVSSAQMATRQAIYLIEIVEVLRMVNLQGEFKTSVSLIGEMINKVALEGEI